MYISNAVTAYYFFNSTYRKTTRIRKLAYENNCQELPLLMSGF
jgi:hypothetical protein